MERRKLLQSLLALPFIPLLSRIPDLTSLCHIRAQEDIWTISYDGGKTWERWNGPDREGKIGSYGPWQIRSHMLMCIPRTVKVTARIV